MIRFSFINLNLLFLYISGSSRKQLRVSVSCEEEKKKAIACDSGTVKGNLHIAKIFTCSTSHAPELLSCPGTSPVFRSVYMKSN